MYFLFFFAHLSLQSSSTASSSCAFSSLSCAFSSSSCAFSSSSCAFSSSSIFFFVVGIRRDSKKMGTVREKKIPNTLCFPFLLLLLPTPPPPSSSWGPHASWLSLPVQRGAPSAC